MKTQAILNGAGTGAARGGSVTRFGVDRLIHIISSRSVITHKALVVEHFFVIVIPCGVNNDTATNVSGLPPDHLCVVANSFILGRVGGLVLDQGSTVSK